MMNKAVISIVATECREACRGIDTLEDKLRAAFKLASNHWMCTDSDGQFQGAIAGVFAASNETDQQRLTVESRALSAVNASLSGIPVNMSAVELPENPIGLLKLWHEAKGDR